MGSAAFCAAPIGTTDASCVHLSDAQGWLATFEFQEELRADAKELLAAFQSEGIEAHLLSGDTDAATCQVMSQLDGLIARRNSRASCSPQDKLAYLRDLQRRGHRAAMVGDGLNDGPAQGAADVSIAFGCAVPVTQARADVVVLGDQLMALAQTFVIARKAMSVVRQNLVWAAVYNAACIPLAVMGLLPAWLAGLGMAASSLVVVVNALRLSGPIVVTPTDSAREQLVAGVV
jgi:Cu2+-exporting ATPase